MVVSWIETWGQRSNLAASSFLDFENRLDRLPLDDSDLERPREDLEGDDAAEDGESTPVSKSTAAGADLRRRVQLNIVKEYQKS